MITDISQLDPNGTYTYADYLKWQFDEWVELLEGAYRVFNKPGKSPLHQQVTHSLGRELTKQIHQPHYDIWHLPLPLILGYLPAQESLDLVIPDIFVIHKEPPNLSDETGWHGTPLFVAEVADRRTATIDITVKFDLYQRHGVSEYWIVQLQEQNVHVYTLENGKYALVGIYETGDIPSRIFPQLTISHERIFQ